MVSRAPFSRKGERCNPPSSIARLTGGHAAQVRAHAEHDEPLRFLHAVVVGLRIAKNLPIDLARLVDLVLRAMADEDGLPAPLYDRVHALRDAPQLHFDLGQHQHVHRGERRAQELGH